MRTWHLAQINIGRLVAPEGDVRVQPFFDALDRINADAEASPGFIWRLKGAGDNATDLRPTVDPLLLVNMSVWENAEALFNFVYRTTHTAVMAARRDWFEQFEGSYMALWWVPIGHEPSVSEGIARLWHLDRFGPTPHAFTFKARFPEPGRTSPPIDMKPDPWCVGRA